MRDRRWRRFPSSSKDVAVWQHEERKRPSYQAARQYRLEQFATEPPRIDILTGGRRPKQRRFVGAACTRRLPDELNKELNQFARKTDATLYMVLFAAYAVLLSKYTSEEDIVIGTPIAGRDHTSMNRIVGMFVNTLPVRVAPKREYTVRQWVQVLREHVLRAFEHGHYPLDELLEQLNVTRDPSRNPLFDTVFVLQDAKKKTVQLPQLSIEPLEWQSRNAKFDMTWVVDESEDALRLTVEYDTDLYTETQMQRMLMHFEHILVQMIREPEQLLKGNRINHGGGKADRA